jgi:hypothetical protein
MPLKMPPYRRNSKLHNKEGNGDPLADIQDLPAMFGET